MKYYMQYKIPQTLFPFLTCEIPCMSTIISCHVETANKGTPVVSKYCPFGTNLAVLGANQVFSSPGQQAPASGTESCAGPAVASATHFTMRPAAKSTGSTAKRRINTRATKQKGKAVAVDGNWLVHMQQIAFHHIGNAGDLKRLVMTGTASLVGSNTKKLDTTAAG